MKIFIVLKEKENDTFFLEMNKEQNNEEG